MAVIYLSNDYMPVFGTPEFKVGVDSTDFFDCTIKESSGEVLGVKRLGGSLSYNVNVANYAKRALFLEPQVGEAMGFVELEGRVTAISIALGSFNSSQAKISAAREVVSYGQFLSELSTKRDIACGECDELSFLSQGGSFVASIVAKDSNGIKSVLDDICYEDAAEGFVGFVVNMDDMDAMLKDQAARSLEEYSEFEVVIKNDDEILAEIEYSIVEADSRRVRLCWWNDYGAIDYYSFYSGEASKLSTQKQLIKTDSGYRAECSQIEHSKQLFSKNLISVDAQGLSKIIYAPAVWVCDDSQASQVAVSTTSIEQSDGQMPIVSFEILEIEDQQD